MPSRRHLKTRLSLVLQDRPAMVEIFQGSLPSSPAGAMVAILAGLDKAGARFDGAPRPSERRAGET